MIAESARIRLNLWQQATVAVGSAVGALLDPRRADLIAALGETTGKPAFQSVLERMKRSPEGRIIRSTSFQGRLLKHDLDSEAVDALKERLL
ncbi:hypothetical protein EZV62_018805 [Acer yangbiense]|uniref:Ubiquinone biosynthesis protein n=1 Tax=Acer yangbiense TaxID=1000413 RepID=A0A5C7H9V6_9ROSI|nr:hypothetical protein EZV62_018805 [Acer yangbiense]